MLTMINQTRFYLRNRALLFWSFFLPVLLLLPLSIWAHNQDEKTEPATMLLVLALAMSTAFFLASSQQDLMSRAFSFLMPDLRANLVRDQILTGITVAGLTFVAAMVVPGLVAVIQGSVALGWSLVCLVMIAYALTVLVVLRFVYASWLPFQAVWMFAIGTKFMMWLPPQKIHLLLDQTALLTAVAAVTIFLLGQQLRSRALQRQVAQRPYISLADLKNSKRIEEFKRARNMHKQTKDEGLRPFHGLLQWANRRVAASRERNDQVGALVWEAWYLALTKSILRSRWRIAAGVTLFGLTFVYFGYFDSRALLRGDTEFTGWFSGILFITTTGVSMMAYHLRMRTSGRLFARQEVLRAGRVSAVFIVAAGVAGSLILFGLGHLLAAFMPKITLGEVAYFMVGPGWHVLGAPLFFVPVQLLLLVLWRNPGPCTILQQSGTLSFFIYHGAFSLMGTGPVLVPMAAVVAVLWLALFMAWRWRVLRKDLT